MSSEEVQVAEPAQFGLVVRWTVEAPDDIPTVLGRVAEAVHDALLAEGIESTALDHDLWLCTDTAREQLDAFIKDGFGA